MSQRCGWNRGTLFGILKMVFRYAYHDQYDYFATLSEYVVHSGSLDSIVDKSSCVTKNKCTLYWAAKYKELKFNVFGHQLIDSYRRGVYKWTLRSNNPCTCIGLTNSVVTDRSFFVGGKGSNHYIFNLQGAIVYNCHGLHVSGQMRGNISYSRKKQNLFTVELEYDSIRDELSLDRGRMRYINPDSNYRLICILLDYEDNIEILDYSFLSSKK